MDSRLQTLTIASSASHDPILTIQEVANDLRCSKAHVYNAINGTVEGVSPLPAIQMGRRKLVRRSTLEHWKESNETRRTDGNLAVTTSERR
jgi:excisionase family DNA binding protein